MRKLLIATFNPNKLKEIRGIARDMGVDFEFIYLKDFPDIKEVIEDGKSFEENAIKKAQGYFKQTQVITLAEDSGLWVSSLNGLPGVYSSRFSGEDKDDYKNNIKILNLLREKSERKAEFICVSALVLSKEKVEIFRGELRGEIAFQMRGKSGFGYDPVFVPEGYDKTLAELGPEIKNKISHRRKAIQEALEFLNKYIEE